MASVPKLILQNPFRVLGVYANSPKRDIVANKGKATAFLKVNRSVEYPLDLKEILPPINRTIEQFNEAESHLTIPKEQIQYAQFWFLKMNQLDEIAFNHLFAGNIDQAISIWSKQDNLSSLQNKMICYLIKGSLPGAISLAQLLYKNFGDCYIEKIDSSSTLKLTGVELRDLFINSLGESIGMTNLLNAATDAEWKTYISTQTVGPLISKISAEVEKTKKVDHKDPKARIDAARKLVTSTKESFTQLKGILKANDPQFVMIADKLGLEILQCGIDYFNNSEEDDAPHTAMKMQKYAQSVVVGTLAKQRCEENVKILQKIIDELPPKDVMAEDKAIKSELSRFVRLPDKISHAITLLNNTKSHLQSIKQKLGASNAYYLRLSTQIVRNALHNVVEEVNAVQQGNVVELDNGLTIDLDEFASPEDRRSKYNRVKAVVREAWNATTIMDSFDLEAKFKTHYNQNRNTLKSMCDDLGISTYTNRPSSATRPIPKPSSSPSATRSTTSSGLGYTGKPSTVYEREYGNASAGESLWEHIKSPGSSRWEAALLVTIIGGIIGFLIYYNNPYTYDVDEKFKCIAWGTGIGAISWLCIFVDDDNKSGDWGDLAARGGCYGVILFLGLFLFYWIYKIIRLSIDGIKGA